CYGKTHKNEIFTHAGGDWMPEEKVSKPKSSSSKSPVREVIDYQYEFVDEEAVGEIELIYEEGEMMYLSLDDGSLFQVSYAGSPVDLSMAKQLLDITQPVEIQYRKGGEVNQLIAIDQVYQEVTPKKGKSYSMYIIGFFFLTFLYFLRRKTTAQPSFVIRTF
ncbi:hypothetical protein KKA95_02395, partial [Patescibacteria group bacterium]|nr:hypothetical protein [Patescibacteria group bacterium]